MLLKISKSEFPYFWIRLPRHRWPKSRSNIEDPVVPLERNVYGHQDCCGKDNSRRFCWNLDGEKFRIGNVFFVHRKQELFLSGLRWWHQNDWKEAEYGSNVEEFDETCGSWRNQHHFLTTYIWDALNVNANQMQSVKRSIEKCSNHEFLLLQLKNYQDWKKRHAKAVAWSCNANWQTRKWSR